MKQNVVQRTKSGDATSSRKPWTRSGRSGEGVNKSGHIEKRWLDGIGMDCGTCDSAPTLQVHAPEVVDVTLTMTSKATSMLEDAFGDDRSHALLVGVLSGGCSGYMYDLQIVESTDTPCQELNINGFRVLVPSASSHLLDGIEIDYVDRLMGGGFKINNPNASSSCGCGESFS